MSDTLYGCVLQCVVKHFLGTNIIVQVTGSTVPDTIGCALLNALNTRARRKINTHLSPVHKHRHRHMPLINNIHASNVLGVDAERIHISKSTVDSWIHVLGRAVRSRNFLSFAFQPAVLVRARIVVRIYEMWPRASSFSCNYTVLAYLCHNTRFSVGIVKNRVTITVVNNCAVFDNLALHLCDFGNFSYCVVCRLISAISATNAKAAHCRKHITRVFKPKRGTFLVIVPSSVLMQLGGFATDLRVHHIQ